MTEEASFGVRRLRQAIANQATCGSGKFELSIDSADRLWRECEDQLARLSWAEDAPAPVDADGKLIQLRTEKLYTDEGEEFSVGGFSYLRDEKAWAARGVRKHSERLYEIDLRRLHLRRPDSWEKLEDDARKSQCDYFGMPDKCKECPANNNPHCSCNMSKALDIVRRAKALAGVSDDD